MTSTEVPDWLEERVALTGQSYDARAEAEDALCRRVCFRTGDVEWLQGHVDLNTLSDGELETLVVLADGPMSWSELLVASRALGPEAP